MNNSDKNKYSIKKATKASILHPIENIDEIEEKERKARKQQEQSKNEQVDLKVPRLVANSEQKKKDESLKEEKKEETKKGKNYFDTKAVERGNLVSSLDHDDDLFDEDGNLLTEKTNLEERMEELKAKIDEIFAKISLIGKKIKIPFLKAKQGVLFLATKIFSAFSGVFTKINKGISKIFKIKVKELDEGYESKAIEQKEEEPKTPEDLFITASFNDMHDLNIFFTDNYDVNLYQKKKNASLEFGSAEENIMFMNAILAIKQCSELTAEVPPIKEGFYENKPVSQVMENVSELDIKLFLGYVKARPKKYTSQKWKISETFATWLVNNSPMAEKD